MVITSKSKRKYWVKWHHNFDISSYAVVYSKTEKKFLWFKYNALKRVWVDRLRSPVNRLNLNLVVMYFKEAVDQYESYCKSWGYKIDSFRKLGVRYGENIF